MCHIYGENLLSECERWEGAVCSHTVALALHPGLLYMSGHSPEIVQWNIFSWITYINHIAIYLCQYQF